MTSSDNRNGQPAAMVVEYNAFVDIVKGSNVSIVSADSIPLYSASLLNGHRSAHLFLFEIIEALSTC